MSTLIVQRTVDCPFSATIEFAENALARRPEIRVSPQPPLGESVQVAAKSVRDLSDAARSHDALLIAWTPRHAIFPRFHGFLSVRPKKRGSRLRLHGRYDAPGGTIGKIFDAIAGRAIARATVRHLLDDLAADIETQYAKEGTR
jgi:hypothetical protein